MRTIRSRLFWRLYTAHLIALSVLLTGAYFYFSNLWTKNQLDLVQIKVGVGFIFVLSLATAGAIAYLFLRSLKERIQQIAIFSERAAASTGSERIPFTETDELDRLEQSVRSTTDKLQKTIGQLVAERNKTEAVLTGMVEGVMAVDAGKKVILVNPAFQSILHLGAASPLGKPLLEATRNPEMDEMITAVLQNREQVNRFITITFPEEKIFEAVAVPLILKSTPKAEPITTGALVVLHDITQLKKLEAVRRDFIANVSHELRTPLTAIKGYAETLLDGAIEDQDHRGAFVETIYNHANRLTGLTEDLLLLSTIEADGFRLNIRKVQLMDMIEPVMAIVKEQADKKGQAIQLDIPSGLPCLMVDKQRIEDVLVNLLDNANKFTPNHGNIRIQARPSAAPGLVEISVRDNGMGIPQQDLPRIFERFYRVDKARSRRLGGTGLGLSIVKHTVESHGGSVWAESFLGEGSTFYFTLPVVQSADDQVQDPMKQYSPG